MRAFITVSLLLALLTPARADVAPYGIVDVAAPPRSLALVPSVHRGHSVMWKTGAIITAASVGVTLLGAGLVLLGISNGAFGHCDITEGEQCPADPVGSGLFIAGIAISVAGDGGLFIGGPATWIAGARRGAE